ncbi:DNA-binding protein [Aphanothece hegewaldii CCALA 016]|uniref:DNA-binding protein n=1 Tax=Aphanothece hegewaldii CCALA 016 TaxID=2107694 RepID=A0A2T1LQZ8_9CHRO|nr:DNA-binding protein [Aphanothece hegewaldii]PSF30450.1 DNA-binding protein [Aphanothece hegewaldii CCALA 016]
MPNPLATTELIILRPEDFDPPLKRIEPSVPGYWTLDELAAELGVSLRKVQYDVTGRPEANQKPSLKAYKAGPTFLVADAEALEYIQKYRKGKKSS